MNLDKKTKDMVIFIAAIVSVVAILFLPFISIMGQSISLVETLTAGMDLGLDAGVGDFALLASIIGGAAAIFFGWKKDRKSTMIASIVGAAGIVIFVVVLQVSLSEAASFGMKISAFDILGLGVWLSLIAHVANIVLCYLKDPVETQETTEETYTEDTYTNV